MEKEDQDAQVFIGQDSSYGFSIDQMETCSPAGLKRQSIRRTRPLWAFFSFFAFNPTDSSIKKRIKTEGKKPPRTKNHHKDNYAKLFCGCLHLLEILPSYIFSTSRVPFSFSLRIISSFRAAVVDVPGDINENCRQTPTRAHKSVPPF